MSPAPTRKFRVHVEVCRYYARTVEASTEQTAQLLAEDAARAELHGRRIRARHWKYLADCDVSSAYAVEDEEVAS